MKDIPIEFEHKGKRYQGSLSLVNGAGASHYHLMINKYFHGQLFFTNNQWQFGSQTGEFKELAKFFGDHVTDWLANNFNITIQEGYKKLSFPVQRFDITGRSEKFRIAARNKTIVLESNRPLFRNKGLKHRHPDWKLIDGELSYSGAVEKLANAIMKVIEPGN
jgi:hypothetical protein